ncbi:hypothetical protein AB0M43_14300 [Longispora sp. NPDC051575]|uniref:hypothetical protein n=1 Tax=Longispora sp. NPDC051575 TaxID=3154943 RepID=UPI003434786C
MTTDVEYDDLGPLELIDTGGQGTVSRVPSRPGQVLKEYLAGVAVRADKLRLLIERPGLMSQGDQRAITELTAWPTARVVRNGACVGFLMPEAPARFHVRLQGLHKFMEVQYLMTPAKPMWKDDLALPSTEERLELVKQFVRLFHLLNSNDIILGDVSMKNFFWACDDGPGVYAIDCDGFRINGHSPATVHAQTPGWADPHLRAGEATLDSDRYKLAILVLRLLLEDHHVTPEKATADDAILARLDEVLHPLVAQAAGRDRRPRAEAWMHALDGRPRMRLEPHVRRAPVPAPPVAPPPGRPRITLPGR